MEDKAQTNQVQTASMNRTKAPQKVVVVVAISSFHIDTPERISVEENSILHKPLGSDLELKNNFLPSGKINVGITSGASTPDKVVADVIEKLIDIAS